MVPGEKDCLQSQAMYGVQCNQRARANLIIAEESTSHEGKGARAQQPPRMLLPCILPPAVLANTKKLERFIMCLTKALPPLKKFCDSKISLIDNIPALRLESTRSIKWYCPNHCFPAEQLTSNTKSHVITGLALAACCRKWTSVRNWSFYYNIKLLQSINHCAKKLTDSELNELVSLVDSFRPSFLIISILFFFRTNLFHFATDEMRSRKGWPL